MTSGVIDSAIHVIEGATSGTALIRAQCTGQGAGANVPVMPAGQGAGRTDATATETIDGAVIQDEGKISIMGSKSDLLRTLANAGERWRAVRAKCPVLFQVGGARARHDGAISVCNHVHVRLAPLAFLTLPHNAPMQACAIQCT